MLIQQHDGDAELVAAQRIDNTIELGDPVGEASWKRMLAAITPLRRTSPTAGEHLQYSFYFKTASDVVATFLARVVQGWGQAQFVYNLSIEQVYAWGDLVRAAFDCFLPALATKLGYQLPKSGEDQRKFWTEISQRVTYYRPLKPEDWLPAQAAPGAVNAAVDNGTRGNDKDNANLGNDADDTTPGAAADNTTPGDDGDDETPE